MSDVTREFLGAFARWAFTPLGLFFWLTLLVTVILLRRPKARLAWVGFFILLLWLLSMPLTGKLALKNLSSLAPSPNVQGTVDAIVVPAGGAVHDGFSYHPSPSSLRRLRAALHVASKEPPLLLGIESSLMGEWMKAQGFLPGVAYQTETHSLNTQSNFEQAAKRLAHLKEGAQVALVTDKFHTPRCLLWATYYAPHLRWVTVSVPEATMPPRLPFDLLPSSKGLEYTTLALRELAAFCRDWVRVRYLHLTKHEKNHL